MITKNFFGEQASILCRGPVYSSLEFEKTLDNTQFHRIITVYSTQKYIQYNYSEQPVRFLRKK